MPRIPKVNHHVHARIAWPVDDPTTVKLRPGTVTQVANGTEVDVRVGHHEETYEDLVQRVDSQDKDFDIHFPV
jgi:hypothetical protein